MSDETRAKSRRGVRGVYGALALGALIVTMLFATIGDGVDAPGATGVRAVVIELGHTLVWALLAVAFAVAAVRGSWSAAANRIAVAAGVTYIVFLVAVFVWP